MCTLPNLKTLKNFKIKKCIKVTGDGINNFLDCKFFT